MKRNTKNILVFTTGLVFLTGALIAFYMYNAGPIDVSDSKAIKVDPATLYHDYVNDSKSAQKRFDGKVLVLTGEVAGVTENTQKQQVILLKTSGAGGHINCTMEKPLPGVTIGNIVKLKGICSGMGQGDADLGIAGDVYLTRTLIAE